jgi:hypothetical protein
MLRTRKYTEMSHNFKFVFWFRATQKWGGGTELLGAKDRIEFCTAIGFTGVQTAAEGP